MQARSSIRLGGFAAAVMVMVFFAPMILISIYGEKLHLERASAGEVTVGIAVVLRATARRFIRGASSNMMRTTVGAFGRTSARAATRRFVKFAGRLFFGAMVQDSADEEAPAERGVLSQVISLAVGYAALCLSFFGILRVVARSHPEHVTDLLGAGGLSEIEAVLLAGLPLLAYAALHQVVGRVLAVRATYRTEIDGLLLQAYFTGAGSFLPLTTDVEFTGTERSKRWLAICSILGMFGLHVLLMWLSPGAGSPLEFLGAMFLIYCFVYAFPIKPLEGHFIWASSKLQWALVAAPILYAFLNWLPIQFGEIL